MEKKEWRKAAPGLRWSGRRPVNSKPIHLHFFQGNHIQESENADQHTLAPVKPDDSGVLFGIVLIFVNKKQVQQDQGPDGGVADNFPGGIHSLKIKKNRGVCPAFI